MPMMLFCIVTLEILKDLVASLNQHLQLLNVEHNHLPNASYILFYNSTH